MVAGPDLPLSTSTHEDGEISDTHNSMETKPRVTKFTNPCQHYITWSSNVLE